MVAVLMRRAYGPAVRNVAGTLSRGLGRAHGRAPVAPHDVGVDKPAEHDDDDAEEGAPEHRRAEQCAANERHGQVRHDDGPDHDPDPANDPDHWRPLDAAHAASTLA